MPTIYKTIWFFTGGMAWEWSWKKDKHIIDGALWTQRAIHFGPFLFVFSILRKQAQI